MKSGKKLLLRAIRVNPDKAVKHLRKMSNGNLRSLIITATPLADFRGAERILDHALVESARRFVYGPKAHRKGDLF